MSQHLVVDANVLVDALVQVGARGRAARAAIREQHLAAPEVLRIEAVGVLRKLVRNETITEEAGDRAVNRLEKLPLHTVGSAVVLARVWELRHDLTSYDASYTAVAEHLDAELVTRDTDIHGVPGLRCVVRMP